MALMDKVLNMVTGRNMETIHVELEEFAQLLNREFIECAVEKSEFEQISKTVRGGIFSSKQMTSKNGRYEIHRSRKSYDSLVKEFIWIHDIEKDIYYDYTTRKMKKLVKRVDELIRKKRLEAM